MEGPWCRVRREARAREQHQTSTLQWRIGLKALDPERPIREADIAEHRRDVCFVPNADMQLHSIVWSVRARVFGGSQVDDQLELVRLPRAAFIDQGGDWTVHLFFPN